MTQKDVGNKMEGSGIFSTVLYKAGAKWENLEQEFKGE